MPKICYVEKKFRADSLELIRQANEIIAEYDAAGYSPTLRQLYYQLVSKNIIRNKQTEYDRLGSIINDARLAGLVDWSHITDLTRELRGVTHWESPASIVKAVSQQYRIDKWEGQEYRAQIWVEKDALRNVIERAATPLDVDYFSCRGYVSQSEMWAAAQKLRGYIGEGQIPVILHLGDHDPSGIDMTRDIRERLELFGVTDVQVRRLALNMEQVREYSPPPNPAKVTDSRFTQYQQEHGDESWELDALEPTVITGLITDAVASLRDDDLYAEREALENEHRRLLRAASRRWDDVATYLGDPADGSDEEE